MKKKVWDITVKDNPNRVVMGENDEFYTTDTEAYLVFKLEDESFNPATAVLTLENRNDGSLKNETVDVVDGLIEWEMPQRYIEHFGNWQGQLVYEDTKDGQPELYTSAPFTFVVNAHIGDKKKPSLVEIENWEKFIRDGTELIETWEDMEDLRQVNEAQRQANYQELLDTGVLQTNINTKLEALEEEYAPKLTEVTAQLPQKVGGGKLAEMGDLSQEVKEAMTGGSVAVVGEGAVSNINLANDVKVEVDKIPVHADKLDGFEVEVISKNVFNGEDIRRGGKYSTSGGVWETVQSYNTGRARVKEGVSYRLPHLAFVQYWDKYDNFIRGTPMITSLIPPEGAYYTTFGAPTSSPTPIEDWMVVEGTSYPSEYIPYEYKYKLDINSYTIEDENMSTKQKVLLNTISQDSLSKVDSLTIERVNLFNYDTDITRGGYYRHNDGVWHPSQYVSIEIEIDFTKSYMIPDYAAVTYWTRDNVFIVGFSVAGGRLSVPNNPDIAKVRFGVPNSSPTPIEDWMVVEGTSYPSEYIPYEKVKIKEIERLQKAIDGVSRNSVGSISINVDGHSQTTHPSILYFEDGWNGYRFWLAITPFPNGVAVHENPCIVASNNLIDWEEPLFGMNPLDTSPGADIYYNSDTELVYNDKTDTLEVWWRRYVIQPSANIEYYRRTSTDGVNWTEKELLHSGNVGVSPSVQMKDDGTYAIWVMRGKSVNYFESPDGHNWELIRVIDLPRAVWHGTFRYTGDKYEAYFSYGDGNSAQNYFIGYSESKDNVTYTEPEVVLEGVPLRYDHMLYRPTFVDCPNLSNYGTVRVVAYGQVGDGNVNNVGISLSYKDAPSIMRGLNFIDS